MEKETHKSKVEIRHQFYKRSHFSASAERSNQNCTGTTQPIHINTVCCETSLKRKTDFQLKEFESVCTALQAQDGRSGLVRKLIQPGDFMMKLDLQDAYFSVPIHDNYKLNIIYGSSFREQHAHRHAASSTEREAPKHSGRMQEGIPKSFYVDDRVVSPSRQNDPLHTNGTGTGSIALPCTTATAHKHTAPPEDKLSEQDQDFLIKGLINRFPMVDLTSNNSIQLHSTNPTSIRYGHIHGCIHTGMGGPMQWNIYGGTLDSPGIQEPHQRSRVKSCLTGHQILSSHSNTEATAHQFTDGKFYSSCLRQ